jgi:hypothetical protein
VALAFVYWVLSGYAQDNVKAALEQFQAENEERFNDHDGDHIFMPYTSCADDQARQRHGLPPWPSQQQPSQAPTNTNSLDPNASNALQRSAPAPPNAPRPNAPNKPQKAPQGFMARFKNGFRSPKPTNGTVIQRQEPKPPATQEPNVEEPSKTLPRNEKPAKKSWFSAFFNKSEENKPKGPNVNAKGPNGQAGGAKKKPLRPSRPRKTTRSKRS